MRSVKSAHRFADAPSPVTTIELTLSQVLERPSARPATCLQEQVRGEKLDARSNLFPSASLFEIATRSRPCSARLPVTQCKAILDEDPPDVSQTSPNSCGLQRVRARCLAKIRRSAFSPPQTLRSSPRGVGTLLPALLPQRSTRTRQELGASARSIGIAGLGVWDRHRVVVSSTRSCR